MHKVLENSSNQQDDYQRQKDESQSCNEAFSAQAIPCILELGLPEEKTNPTGGAIAYGHPLGGTGAVLTCKAISYLKRTGGTYGLITMCVGGGIGAAGIIKML